MKGFIMDFAYIGKLMLAILGGTKVTLLLFAVVLILSIPLGFLITLMMKSKIAPLQWFVTSLVFIIRGTPLLLQLFFIYFGLPFLPVVGKYFMMNGITAAIIGFTLNYAAYFGEIFRGGILAIDKGQYEAAKVLGLSRVQTLYKVIVPQMIRVTMPSITNEAVNLVKDTALVFSIAVPETLKVAKTAVMRDGDPMGFVVAFGVYLIINTVVQLVFKQLEKYTNRFDKEEV